MTKRFAVRTVRGGTCADIGAGLGSGRQGTHRRGRQEEARHEEGQVRKLPRSRSSAAGAAGRCSESRPGS